VPYTDICFHLFYVLSVVFCADHPESYQRAYIKYHHQLNYFPPFDLSRFFSIVETPMTLQKAVGKGHKTEPSFRYLTTRILKSVNFNVPSNSHRSGLFTAV
jgi:hypothetical protein